MPIIEYKESTPIGTIMAFPVDRIPSGWLICNGVAVSRTTYKALFDVIGTTYGAGDGSTTFNVPDFQGKFLRGIGGNAAAIGTIQGDAFKSHTHPEQSFIKVSDTWRGGGGSSPDDATGRSGWGFTTGATGDVETRPINMAVVYCIKY
jgi:phage-related tail fiber protein